MIPRIAHGQPITAEKLNQVIDALNAVTPASSSLPMHASSKGMDVSVPKRPRSFYAVITESQDRPRDDKGEVADGEYEWKRVMLSSGAGFVAAEGDVFGSAYDVYTGLLHNPAYELCDQRDVEIGSIVRMRPVDPVFENDILAVDDNGDPILDDDGDPIVESARRGFLRRYAFAEPRGPGVAVVRTEPPGNDDDPGYVVANHMGVFDGRVVTLDTTQFDGPAAGDFRGAEYTPTGICWMLPLRETPEGTDLEEEKLNVLPSYTRFKALYMGELDFGGDIRPLYSFDDELAVRQFELTDDWLQNADESWDISCPAVFVDQPDVPGFTLYRPVEINVATSAYYFGVGRKGWGGAVGPPPVAGHKGSCGFCRWSRTVRRWEYIEGCFKIAGIGVTTANIAQGFRGAVTLWWKDITKVSAIEGSGMPDIQALNYTDEWIRSGSKVTLAYDRMENLWMIMGVEFPFHLESTEGVVAELGHSLWDDTDPGVGFVGAYFDIALVGLDPHDVTIGVNTRGHSGGVDPDVPGITMNFQDGLLVDVT